MRNILPQSGMGQDRNGARVCPTGNEIGLKISPDYYLSTTVEYPVQNFSPTRDPGPPFLPLEPPLDLEHFIKLGRRVGN
ncbi:hypothetical protein AVEN_238813-1 [Araneus ventricosus]|uniref:Uncharacterized protein n=1 Tax=Araneus ventricosus TaxID=182803 RepID=A0A4Y2HKZ4_ARAVE|nr:hypothetical protein AVEN_238813-1 [Araneus ventricosus]